MIRHLKKIHHHVHRHIKKPRHNRHHEFLAALVVALYVSVYVMVPFVGAASLANAKDRLSTSAPAVSATHNLSFQTGVPLGVGDKIRVSFPAGFTNIIDANVSCPGASTASASGQDAICTATGLIGAGVLAITIASVNNPATSSSYLIEIATEDADGDILEKSSVMISIIQQVTVTATVNSTLAFVVSGKDSGSVVNGITTTSTSTATSSPFGILAAGATSTVAQDLSVSTNAANGFVVTVFQDQELHNNSGSTINSFNNSADNTGSTTPQSWTEPLAVLDQTHTYGHMALTISDADILANGGPFSFSGSLFAGLSGTSSMEIMRHTGPADGAAADKGLASVLYAAKISALQEAGDYTNTLTYVCTPTY